MRASRLLPFLAVLLFALPALADDKYLGTIVSAGSTTNNLTTAAPFPLQAKTRVSIQCDAACYVVEACADTGTGATATSTGVKLSADALFDIALGMSGSCTNYSIAVLPVSGSVNAKVYQST